MFEEYSKKIMDKIVKHFDLDNDPIYPEKFKKFIKWFGYKGMPFILSIATILVLFWIMFRIYDRSGFERVIIIMLILILLAVRNISKQLR